MKMENGKSGAGSMGTTGNSAARLGVKNAPPAGAAVKASGLGKGGVGPYRSYGGSKQK